MDGHGGPPRPDLSRLHRRFLGYGAPIADLEGVPPVRVVSIGADARDPLDEALGLGGPRGGLLFGRREGDTLHVTHAAPGGYPPFISNRDPLGFDGRYALGWVDALRSTGPVDWIGVWVVHGHRRAERPHHDHVVWAQARARALVDAHHVLVVVERAGLEVGLRAYGGDTLGLEVVGPPPGGAARGEGP